MAMGVAGEKELGVAFCSMLSVVHFRTFYNNKNMMNTLQFIYLMASTMYRGLYGSTRCCISQWPLQWVAQISTPHPTSLNRFWWNSKPPEDRQSKLTCNNISSQTGDWKHVSVSLGYWT